MPRPLPFQVATFVGAFLLFLIQPILAKQILPWFGGAPAVWTASLLFFQTGLTAGYVYAHALGRLNIKWQTRIHVLLLVGAAATLPILVSAYWQPVAGGDASPAWRVVFTLAATAGIPYVLLSATAPLLQSWWRLASRQEPYRLYALSNAGSLLALVAFPALVEPALTVPRQATFWTVGYAAFVIACGFTARTCSGVLAGREEDEADDGRRSGAGDYLVWILLSACGAGLLSATTNQLCQDVAVVPLLWLLPLAVYLVTFILTFGGYFPRRTARALLVVGALSSLVVTVFAESTPLVWQVTAFLVLLGGACMVCHGELVASRPAGRHLTGFYVAMSAGGAIGGAAVALLAPRLFTSFAELPLLVIVALMVALVPPSRSTSGPRHNGPALAMLWAIPTLAFGVSIQFLPGSDTKGTSQVEAHRDFFGILRVQDHDVDRPDSWRALYSGRVLHGLQMKDPAERRTPTTYFAAGSGVAVAFEEHPRRIENKPLRAAVVGLGVGTIAAWGRAGDEVVFYELNPAIVNLARRHFTFLSDSSARTRIVLGDARLSLEREMTDPANHGTYDLIVVDAFAGDAVPVHLLTRECFAVYLLALAPSGAIAFHISNRHVNLGPPVAGLAAEAGLSAVAVSTATTNRLTRTSDWVLLSRDAAFLNRASSRGGVPLSATPQVVWTDHYNSIVGLLR